MKPANAGFFPLDEQMALGSTTWSERVVQDGVWLSGLVSSYAQAEEILQRIGQVSISDTSLWRQVQQWGERFQRAEAQPQPAERATGPAGASGSEPPASVGRMGASMDGTMIRLRQEGWKELKVGCVFEVEVRPTRDKATGDWLDLGHATHTTYVTHLGGPEVLGQRLWAEAERRHWSRALETQILGDGAKWVWTVAQDHFWDSHQLVDWYHACEHLALAAGLLHEAASPAAQRWLKDRETTLFQGHARRVADELTQTALQKPQQAAALREQAGYFDNNQRRMNYLEMREAGWLIGSGTVESGGKQFKARFAGPGMQWSRKGAEHLLPIRAALLSRRFDDYWQRAAALPQT